MRDISKTFGIVPVLQKVELTVYPGEVHLLAGENGAGKSTLINILGGVITDFEGTIELLGKSVRFYGPLQAAENGIAVIHQELSLIPGMSVSENMFLGRFPSRWGFVNQTSMNRHAARIMSELGWDIDVREPVEHFPLSVRQLIEIAKSLVCDARIIIMDEPSSALNAPDVQRLFQLIDRLKRQNCGIIYITHKMEEIERIADRITVLRDGKFVGSALAPQLSAQELIRWMIGREENNGQRKSGDCEEIGDCNALTNCKEVSDCNNFVDREDIDDCNDFTDCKEVSDCNNFVDREDVDDCRNIENCRETGDLSLLSPPSSPLSHLTGPFRCPVLQLDRVSVTRNGQTVCQDISFSLQQGEVIGLAGLQGAGNSSLLEAVFGVYGPNAVCGTLLLDGKRFQPGNPSKSLKNRIGLLPNDRKEKGLVLSMSISENMNMVQQNCPDCSPNRFGFVSFREQLRQTGELQRALNLKAASLEMDVGHLSGGNQQKVALGKWMLLEPKLLLLDEPTRGVDIGAKRDIYALIEEWKSRGIGILLITSEMPELFALSDRILVMHRGRINGEFGRSEFDSERILTAAM
ncbi:MAG: sugar ABC transporter ATP-binding protein [Thermoguttaceae bacterium]